METVTSEPDNVEGLDINALLEPKTQQGLVEPGSFDKGKKASNKV